MVQHLGMQRGEELAEAHAFLGRDFLERIPERQFEPYRRTVSADPQRSGLTFIVALRLVREQLAHDGSSRQLFFLKRYTCSCGPTIPIPAEQSDPWRPGNEKLL